MRRWLAAYGLSRLIVPLALYTGAALFITWPLATQLTTHVVGPQNPDSFANVRLGWWAGYAVQHGLNPFYQSLFGYPNGFFSSIQWSQPLVYWPMALIGFLTGPIASFNLCLLLELILAGLTAHWLCLAVLNHDGQRNGERNGADTWPSVLAALAGGLVFMASPAMQAHLGGGQINPLANYALPLVLLALYRIVEGEGGWRIAVLGAVALWLLLIANYTASVFSILPILVFGGGYFLLRRPRQLLRWRAIRDVAIVFVGGSLLALPFYVPLIADSLAPQLPSYLQEGGTVYFSSDLLNFAALSPFTPWNSRIAPSFSWLILNENPYEGAGYLGVVATVLAIIAVVKDRRKAALWAVIALGCMLFALGPELKINGQPVAYHIDENSSNVVLPWAVFQDLPLIRVTRTPGRFNFTTGLALGVLAALGLDWLLRLIHRREVQTLIAAGLVIVIVAEYQIWFPFPTTSAELPPYFATLAARSDIRAVFDVPADDAGVQRPALLEQIAHHKPLIAGYVSRSTPVDPAKLTVLSDLALGKAWNPAATSGETSAQVITPDGARAALNENGIDVIVYHLGQIGTQLDKDMALRWANSIFGAPAYQDTQIAVFEVPKTTQKPPVQNLLIAARSTSGWWQQKNTSASRNIYWMTGTSSLYLYAPVQADTRLDFNLVPVLQKRAVDLTVDGHYFRSWSLDSALSQLDFFRRLTPGFHELRFVFAEGCTPLPVAPACLLDNSVQTGIGKRLSFADPACNLGDQSDPLNRVCIAAGLDSFDSRDPGPMAYHNHVVQLGSGMSMRGFRLPPEINAGQALDVETDWHAGQKLPGDYHYFVHVNDLQGKLVAQYDGLPNHGKFPTAQWAVPQDWTEADALTLPTDLTPGTYRVFVGWYRYPDLQRLSVEGSDPGASDGLVYLGDVQVRAGSAGP